MRMSTPAFGKEAYGEAAASGLGGEEELSPRDEIRVGVLGGQTEAAGFPEEGGGGEGQKDMEGEAFKREVDVDAFKRRRMASVGWKSGEPWRRWDIEAADQLEEVYKLLFLNLYNIFKKFEDELAKEGNSYRVDHLKESLKEVSRAYFEEAKWRDEGYIPPLKEYLTVSLITGCYAALPCASFVGMGEEATKEAFDWVTSFPRIIKSICSFCRLLDDVVSNEIFLAADFSGSFLVALSYIY
ncbi:hypothetical protein COCNU_11G002440 [Cocos nucifera]|uniref:Terpene synthase metal-binding domain-containing protein n=1 Tax=Cocos nucifera TaxID=13894 RepID=A0A8K0INF7_COCNU|nr:hypothetical protein COCNU_11G002440 [Cocos nucifera]